MCGGSCVRVVALSSLVTNVNRNMGLVKKNERVGGKRRGSSSAVGDTIQREKGKEKAAESQSRHPTFWAAKLKWRCDGGRQITPAAQVAG